MYLFEKVKCLLVQYIELTGKDHVVGPQMGIHEYPREATYGAICLQWARWASP